MAVNSGAELQSKGRELIRHFQTQGTPVMIGMKIIFIVSLILVVPHLQSTGSFLYKINE